MNQPNVHQETMNGFDTIGPDIPPTDLAWAAGLVDGEGCISIVKYNPGGQSKSLCHRLTLVVVNTDEKTIRRLCEMFHVGMVNALKRHKLEWKTVWRWAVYSQQAASVLRILKPYVFTKSEQLRIALEFMELPRTYATKHGVTNGIFVERDRYCELLKGLK